MTALIGYLAAFITTACYVPQAVHVIRTRHVAGISLMGYSMLFVGVGLWMIYGILLGDWALILGNFISFVLVGIILVMKIRLNLPKRG